MNIENVKKLLLECYSQDLCYPGVQKYWSEDNKCYGMCTITSLVIFDFFGGRICKMRIGDTLHYFNLIDGEIVDITSSQY